MNKAQSFHDLSTAELNEKYGLLKNELFNLRFQQTTGQLKNPLMIRTVRKDIARVLTVLREREIKGGKKIMATKTAKTVAAPESGVRDTHRKELEGIVVSNKMAKTATVAVTTQVADPLYGACSRNRKG